LAARLVAQQSGQPGSVSDGELPYWVGVASGIMLWKVAGVLMGRKVCWGKASGSGMVIGVRAFIQV